MVVLDCSAAIHMALNDELGKMFNWFILKDEYVISSDLLYPEASNVLWKHCRAGILPADEVSKRLEHVISLIDEFYPLREYYREAVFESIRLNHSSYDMYYFLLARRMGATLLSDDLALLELCEQEGIDCIHRVKDARI